MIRWWWMESSSGQRRHLAVVMSLWIAPVLHLLAAINPGAFAQVPTITSISPNTVTAGGPAFTLTVTGTNYNGTSTVIVNGTALVPSSATATQLLATVPAQLIATAGQLPVQVINRAATGGPLPSNTVTLTVAAPGTHLRSLTVSMSRNRLFLGQVALQQSLPPLHRMAASVKDVRRQNVKDVPALDTRHLGHPVPGS